MSQPSFAKRGISLLVVLSMMLAATLAATALYVLLSRYQARSASALYTESALAAAKAGESATKAWLTYEGEQVKATVQEYINQTSTPKKAFKLNINSQYTASANARQQYFDVYLTDVILDSTDLTKPVSLQLVIIGIGQDGSAATETALYELNGLNFQKAPPKVIAPDAARITTDAIYIGNSEFQDVSKPLTIEGDAYIQKAFKTINDGKVHVKGDLVFGKDVVAYISTPITVDSNLYVSGSLFAGTSANVYVKGSAVFNKPIPFWNGTFRVDHDLFFKDTLGQGDLTSFTNGVKGLFSIGGNATFLRPVTLMNDADLQIGGDAIFYDASGWLKAASTAKILVSGNALVYSTVNFRETDQAQFNGSYVKTLRRHYPIATHPWDTSKTPAGSASWSGWKDDASEWGSLTPAIKFADSLNGIAKNLIDSGTNKEVPYTLSFDQISLITDSLGTNWKIIFPNPNNFIDWRKTCDNEDGSTNSNYEVTTKALNCIAQRMPSSFKYNGYNVLDITQVGWSNLNKTSGDSLHGKFILLTASSNIIIPPTASDGYVMIYNQNSNATTFEVVNGGSCNCVIYSKQDLYFGKGTIKGSVVIDQPTVDATNTLNSDTVTLAYDANVLNAFMGSGMILDKNGNSYGKTYYSQYTLSLLSPRLQVDMLDRRYGPTNIDTANAIYHGRTLSLSPTLIAVDAKQYTAWSDLIAANPVQYRISPDSTGCSAPTIISSTPSSAALGVPDTSFNVIYKSACTAGNSPVSHLLIWIRPTPATVSLSSSSAVTSSSSVSSSSQAQPQSSSSSSIASTPASNTSGIGYFFKSCPIPSGKLKWGVRFFNNQEYSLDLSQFRATYYYYSGTYKAKQWSASVLNNSASSPPIFSFTNISPNTAETPNQRHNLMMQVNWPGYFAIANGYTGGIDSLSLNNYGTNDSSYSYMGCQNDWAYNPRLVIERNTGEGWTVVSGTAPDYELGHRIFSFDSTVNSWNTGGSWFARIEKSTNPARHGGGALKLITTREGQKAVTSNFGTKDWSNYDSLVVWAYTYQSGKTMRLYSLSYMQYGSAMSAPFVLEQGKWTRLAWSLNAFKKIDAVIRIGIYPSSAGTYYIDDIMLK